MEQSIPQIQPKTDAEYIAAIEEMQQRMKMGFERIEEIQQRTRETQSRVDRMLDQLEARR